MTFFERRFSINIWKQAHASLQSINFRVLIVESRFNLFNFLRIRPMHF